ncbi:MAG: hypothetical protein ACFE8Z_06635, partial [Candidatus Hermodarchaeota archaeon]
MIADVAPSRSIVTVFYTSFQGLVLGSMTFSLIKTFCRKSPPMMPPSYTVVSINLGSALVRNV